MLYTRASQDEIERRRNRFNRSEKKKFIAHALRSGIFDGIFKGHEKIFDLELLMDGYLPEEYAIHHIIPLGGGGNSDFSNLCIMHTPRHVYLHGIIDSQTTRLRVGQTKRIWLPPCVIENMLNRNIFWNIRAHQLNEYTGLSAHVKRKNCDYDRRTLSLLEPAPLVVSDFYSTDLPVISSIFSDLETS